MSSPADPRLPVRPPVPASATDVTAPDDLPAFTLGPPGPAWSRLLVVGHLKGGSTKTTTAGVLALRLHRHTGGRVLAIDADTRSQSLNRWRSANAAAWPDGVVVMSWAVDDLADRVRTVIGDYDHVIIDTGGHSVPIFKQALLAGTFPRARFRHDPAAGYVRGADLLMPLAPSFFDQDVLPTTLIAAKEVAYGGVPIRARVLLTRVDRGGTRNPDYRSAVQTLDNAGVDHMASLVGYRVRWLRVGNGVPMGPADGEQYDEVLAELLADDPQEVIAS